VPGVAGPAPPGRAVDTNIQEVDEIVSTERGVVTDRHVAGEEDRAAHRRWPGRVRLGVLGGLLVLGAALLGACGGSSAQSAQTTAQSQSSPPASAAKSPAPPQKPAQKAAAPACQQPCAVHNGVVVTVTNVVYGASSGNEFETPEAGNVYVTLNVDMKNNADQEANFNPTDFVLLDGKGIKHTVTITDNCPGFDAVSLTKGADSGPKCIAFEASANAPHGLTLVWTPGFLSGDINIKLT